MQEDVIFQRRNRLKRHFINTSNVLIYGYQFLSDGARVTYQLIDSFDWEDKNTGDSKGFVYPSIEKLAEIRLAGKRTVFRHIQELEKAKLLTRVRRRNKPSILYIEDVSEEEANKYLERFVDRKENNEEKLRSAKNGISQTMPEMPKMAFPYRKENEPLKENENNVNEKKQIRGKGVDVLSNILMQYKLKRLKKTEKPDGILQRDYLAKEIAEKLNDENSLGCYRVIAKKVPQNVIFEVLASVKETYQIGKIKQSRGALFVEIIKKYCKKNKIKLGFKNHSVIET